MKAIILAAGEGTRLRPLTNNVPKCMVKYKDKEIIHYILSVMKQCSLTDIALVSGYKKDVLENFLQEEGVTFYTNPKFAQTNMVATLFNADAFMDDDLIISYADIIYRKEVLQALIESKADFSVVVDDNWKELWSLRMDDPLSDAESLKIRNGKIIEIGKKASNYQDIEGQYIGLIKISRERLKDFKNYYKSLNPNLLYDGKNYQNMYMTTLIQNIIDHVMDVTPVHINGGWIEVDSMQDLLAYQAQELIF